MSKQLLFAQQYSDFRIGIDYVERFYDKAFIIDGFGLYAAVEVKGDFLNAEVLANINKLSQLELVNMEKAIRGTPYLSGMGKGERLEVIQWRLENISEGICPEYPLENLKVRSEDPPKKTRIRKAKKRQLQPSK